ncbi:MAG: MFS transporter [Bacteroidia bacterium]|nr:MFS transporter [Bacteroidia bacterium]
MKLTRAELTILFTLALVQFTHVMDFMIIMPLSPQLMRVLSINPQQFSFLVSSFNIAAGMSALAGVFIIDRLDRRRALVFNYMGFVLGTFSCAMANTYETLIISRIVAGLFGGMSSALILSIISDIIPAQKRGASMGIVMSAFSLASIVGIPVGLQLAQWFDWHTPFLVVGSLGLLVIPLALKFIPPINGHLANLQPFNFKQPLQNVFNSTAKIYSLVLTACLMFGWFIIIPFISPYLVGNVGFTEGQLPFIYLTGGAFSILASPLVGYFSDKFGSIKVFYVAITLSVIVLFLLTHLEKVPMWHALIITSLLFLCSGSRMIPAQSLVSKSIDPATRGSFMSFNSFVQQTSSGIATLIGGSIMVRTANGSFQHYEILGYIAISFSLLALIVIRKIK